MSTSIEDIAAKIASEVVLSDNPGQILKIWRKKFDVPQFELAKGMRISASTLSDYEKGKRPSPGVIFVKKYIENLVDISHKKETLNLRKLEFQGRKPIVAIGEFHKPIKAGRILSALNADILVGEDLINSPIYGYTIVDSIGAIYALSGSDFYKIFGATSERVLVFTKVGMGRSPMVAVRVSRLKPRMTILHGPKVVDDLAKELAKRDKIVLAISHDKKEEELPAILGNMEFTIRNEKNLDKKRKHKAREK